MNITPRSCPGSCGVDGVGGVGTSHHCWDIDPREKEVSAEIDQPTSQKTMLVSARSQKYLNPNLWKSLRLRD